MAHSPQAHEPQERRVVSLRALAIVVGTIVLASIVVRRLHATQVIRTSVYLKTTADTALADEEHRRAFELYEQYLTLNPNDEQVEETISVLLEEQGNSVKALQRAFQINERLLLSDKERDDIRLRQISIADRLGRYSDAGVHLKALRTRRPDQAKVWHFSGIVAKDTGNFADAIRFFENAIALPDPPVEAFGFLATLLTRDTPGNPRAKELLDEAVNRDASPKAYALRAGWLMEQKRFAEAIPDLWAALAEEKNEVKLNAMLLKSIRKARAANATFNSDWENGRLIQHLREVLNEDPDQPRLRLYLSSALWATNQRNAAIDNLKTGISRDPRQFEMHEVLVDYLVTTQRYDEARTVFQAIPDRVLDRGRREFMRGRILMSEEQWAQAIDAFNTAIGFSHNDENISSRARICLALCRRESGDHQASLDTLSALVQSNPDFEGARKGIASAYVMANQIPMAIAEYKQLLHVEDVPPYLANLIIRYNLTLPPRQRDWQDVTEILRDEKPWVKDAVQRGLLQADLLFAKGFPSQAMDQLDRIDRRLPGRPEVARARERLSASDHGNTLIQRVRAMLEEDPRSMEAHTSILRLYLARGDFQQLDQWLTDLKAGHVAADVSPRERLAILAEATTSVADTELTTRGQSEGLKVLQTHAIGAWRELAAGGGEWLRQYVRFYAMHRGTSAALQVADWVKRNSRDRETAAACWLECLKSAPSDPGVRQKVSAELAALVNAGRDNMGLRLFYAESLILMQRYPEARQRLQEITGYDSTNAMAFARLAWLSLLIDGDTESGRQYSERAANLGLISPDAHAIRGLAIAESGHPEDAIRMLSSQAERNRTVASYLFEARALMIMGRESLARDIVLEISQPASVARLDPAELQMLQKMQSQLNVAPRHMTGA